MHKISDWLYLLADRDPTANLSFRLNDFVGAARLLNLVDGALGEVVSFDGQLDRKLSVAQDSERLAHFVENFVLYKRFRSYFGSGRELVQATYVEDNPVSAFDRVEVVNFGKSSKQRGLTAFKAETFAFSGSLTLPAVTSVAGLTGATGDTTTDTLGLSS